MLSEYAQESSDQHVQLLLLQAEISEIVPKSENGVTVG